MVGVKRGRRVQRRPQPVEDEPDAELGAPVPDKTSAKYAMDQIEEFHQQKMEDLLARGVDLESDEEDPDDEEELMGLSVSESEEEEEEEADADSDLDGDKDEDLPNEMAWGTKKKMFYDTDYVVSKGKKPEELEAEEQEEEEEAKNVQKRLAENLSEEDYDLSFFQDFPAEKVEKEAPGKEERIVKDLQEMSQKEKRKLLQKESPELMELIRDFKSKLVEMQEELQPLMEMVQDGRIPPGKGADYLRTKQQLYLNYCTNISFYLVLKAKRVAVHHHPVIQRLLAYRNLINELAAVDSLLSPQLRGLLSGSLPPRGPASGPVASVCGQKQVSEEEGGSDSELDQEAALSFYREVEERLKMKRKRKQPAEEGNLEEEEYDDNEEDEKRGITYQMAKNRGLTPRRKKIDRNPRVKHREKFRRAKIRRKGQVREVRREEARYSGERSGIRAGVKKSIKLK